MTSQNLSKNTNPRKLKPPNPNIMRNPKNPTNPQNLNQPPMSVTTYPIINPQTLKYRWYMAYQVLLRKSTKWRKYHMSKNPKSIPLIIPLQQPLLPQLIPPQRLIPQPLPQVYIHLIFWAQNYQFYQFSFQQQQHIPPPRLIPQQLVPQHIPQPLIPQQQKNTLNLNTTLK